MVMEWVLLHKSIYQHLEGITASCFRREGMSNFQFVCMLACQMKGCFLKKQILVFSFFLVVYTEKLANSKCIKDSAKCSFTVYKSLYQVNSESQQTAQKKRLRTSLYHSVSFLGVKLMLVPAIFDTIAKTLGLSHHMTGRYSVFQICRNRHPGSLFKYDEYIYRGF